jgi:DNA-binding NtrC family response regulator
VEGGSFRQDLYYRVNVVKLEIPPLRERPEDVPLLVEHFIHRFNALGERTILDMSDEAVAVLVAYPFPGNVRELENAIERAFVICRGTTITTEHLPPAILQHAGPERAADEDQRTADEVRRSDGRGVRDGAQPPSGDDWPASESSYRELEASFLLEALRRHHWNRTRTAEALGIHKTTLHRKIRSLGLNPPLK